MSSDLSQLLINQNNPVTLYCKSVVTSDNTASPYFAAYYGNSTNPQEINNGNNVVFFSGSPLVKNVGFGNFTNGALTVNKAGNYKITAGLTYSYESGTSDSETYMFIGVNNIGQSAISVPNATGGTSANGGSSVFSATSILTLAANDTIQLIVSSSISAGTINAINPYLCVEFVSS